MKIFLSITVFLLMTVTDRADEPTPDKVIEIAVRDDKPVFTEKGKDKVVAVVGQTIRWVNTSTKPQHFVSTAEADEKPLIDTGSIAPGKHYDLLLDNTLYRAAGGKTAGLVEFTFRSRGSEPDPRGVLQILSPARR
jgi:plastocyanin